MVDNCSSTRDRTCAPNVPDGNYAIQTAAGGTQECLVHWKEAGKIYPERYSWGGRSSSATESANAALVGKQGADYCDKPICGVCEWDGMSAEENIVKGLEAVWTFRRIDKEMYLIFNMADGQGMRCLGFQTPDAPYPTMLAWKTSTVEADSGKCVDGTTGLDLNPVVECEIDADCAATVNSTCERESMITGQWSTKEPGVPFNDMTRCDFDAEGNKVNCRQGYLCGFEDDINGDAKSKLLANGGTVWDVHALGCNGLFCESRTWANQYVIRSLAGGDVDMNGALDSFDYACLYFPVGEMIAHYTHPRRVPNTPSADGVWLGSARNGDVDGNGDSECGIFASEDDGETQELALVRNRQAAFQLIPLPDY